MEIRVEKAVAKHLVEKCAGRFGQEILDRVPGGDQRRAIIDADSGDPLQCQHAAAGAPPIDFGHAKIRIAGEIFGELRGGGRLKTQIHLELHHLGQGLHHLDRLQPPQHGLKALAQRGQPQKELEIARKSLGDARAQHLYRDILPIRSAGEMDLSNRGCRNCVVIERGKQGLDRPGKLGLDQGSSLVARERRQPILQACQIEGDLLAEEVGAR